MKAHRVLASGFLEAVNNEALKKEFTKSKIPFESQVKLNGHYSAEQLKNIISLILFVGKHYQYHYDN